MGQICLLHENLNKQSVATYKYCKVVRAKLDSDGLVCKAVITYYNVPSMKAKHWEVNICRLSVLWAVERINNEKYGSYKH